MIIQENPDNSNKVADNMISTTDKFKVVQYEFNSSSNLHFKAQRNASILSGVNYPKKNLQKPVRKDESCGGNSDHLSQNGTMPSIHSGNLSQFNAPQIIGNTVKHSLISKTQYQNLEKYVNSKGVVSNNE